MATEAELRAALKATRVKLAVAEARLAAIEKECKDPRGTSLPGVRPLKDLILAMARGEAR